jgi:site-specific DNA recombinase
MKNIDLLQSYAKGKAKDTHVKNSGNAVIYTRVSSKEQAETNQSLETQKKYCLHYALKHNLDVLGFFGGTYESAKTDERNEFNRMIRFVKTQKEGVSFILVYSLDRFSRTGDNAIFISSELKKQGISIISVTQPIDVSTHSGTLQQNIQFIFSKYDNDLRRDKCIDGMREKLLRGEWIGCVPTGYAYDRTIRGAEQRIVVDEKGTLIRKAFHLRARGLSNTEVADKLSKLGLYIHPKRLGEMFRNPFYCGYLAHTFLEGKVIKGKHEPLVSEDIFFRVNEQLNGTAYGYKQSQGNVNIPLKNFVRCASCNTPLVGYIVKRKNLYYYKCNKIGCRCNRSSKIMHQLFEDLIKRYQLDDRFIDPLKEQLLYTYQNLVDTGKDVKISCQKRLRDLEDKLDKLEERYAYAEIDRAIFEKVAGKLKSEIQSVRLQLKESGKKLSNPEEFIAHALNICSNLSDLWVFGGYDRKVKLQDILFPGGILYDKKKDNYRTLNVNLILRLTNSFSNTSGENKKRKSKNFFDFPASVPGAGVEPAQYCYHWCLRPTRLPIPPPGQS